MMSGTVINLNTKSLFKFYRDSQIARKIEFLCRMRYARSSIPSVPSRYNVGVNIWDENFFDKRNEIINIHKHNPFFIDMKTSWIY